MPPTLRALFFAAYVLALPWHVAAQGAAEQDIDPIARQRFQIAAQLYSRGQFAEAADEFQRVYDATQHPDVLHNIYVAHRDAGNKREAAAALRAYIASAEEIPERQLMEARLATLEREIAEEDARNSQLEPEPEPEPIVEPDPDPIAAPAPRPAPAEGPSLLAPALVLGAGAAIAIAGVVMGVVAAGQYADLEDTCGPALICRMEQQDDIDALRTTALLADVLMIGGGVVAAIGTAWLIVELSSSSASATVAGKF